MKLLDLVKATVVCGLISFFVYTYPIIGQVVIIGLLGLLWLTYAYKAIRAL
jgi:hypothetical protein